MTIVHKGSRVNTNLLKKIKNKLAEKKLIAQGFLQYHLLPKSSAVCMVSTMRAGSTLLKALLGQAPDISHVPEYNFSSLKADNQYLSYAKLKTVSDEKIIVLKKPRWFTEEKYPTIPFPDAKVIVLYRDVVGVVKSLSKRWPEKDIYELIEYWIFTYESILVNLSNFPEKNIIYVSYSNLLSHPEKVTKSIFDFLYSQQKEGVFSYAPPKKEGWKWGKDDGSEKIKKMMVMPETEPDDLASKIAEQVSCLPRVIALREKYSKLCETNSLT